MLFELIYVCYGEEKFEQGKAKAKNEVKNKTSITLSLTSMCIAYNPSKN